MERIDMLVIGSGPAGRRAAVQSAKLGKSVLQHQFMRNMVRSAFA